MTKNDGFFQLGENPEEKDLEPDYEFAFDSSHRQFEGKGWDNINFGSIDVLSRTRMVVLDTGTTEVLVPKEAYKEMSLKIKRQCHSISGCSVV